MKQLLNKTSKIKKIIIVTVSIIVAVTFVLLYKRYSFTRERADLYEYLGAKGDEVAIFLNDELQIGEDEKINYKAIKKNNCVYLPLSYVKAYINNTFYHAKDIGKILYSLPDETKVAGDSDIHQMGNAPYIVFLEEPYLLIDYVKDYTNIRYDEYLDDENKRVYIYSDWDKENVAYMKGKESARLQGGNKSPIITDLKKGEEVKILERMTKWIKVKTSDGYIGYIRKTKVYGEKEVVPISNYIEQVRVGKRMSKKPCIGFHQLYSSYSSSNLPNLLKNKGGMNVIAPTWYVIKNDEGEIRSIANDVYSQACHKIGLQVWATVNNFDIEDIDEKKVFSSVVTRKKIINKILREIEVSLLDGINLDIEQVPPEAGEDYMQFIRELSIELNKIGCIFSVDSYVPYTFNKHYNLSELNKFCDYVIIMCYDEHYSGSKEAGSVSSLNYVKDGINLSLESVDKDKLVIALPFYTRIWTTSESGKVTSSAGGSAQIENAARQQGLKFSFDPETCQNYGVKTTQTNAKVECWLEDETSLKYKMSEIKKSDVAGTAAWKLTQERENFFNIINLNN